MEVNTKKKVEVNTKEKEDEQSLHCWPPALGLLPWLVFFHGSSDESQTFYDISECRYHVKSIPELRGKILGTCSYGWLVIIDDDSDDWILLNPISMKKIQLPSNWAPDFIYRRCVLSLPPDHPECIVMFMDFGDAILNVMFCKPGDVEWTRQDLELHDEEFDEPDQAVAVGVHKGDIYVLTLDEHFYFVKVDNSCITLVDLELDFGRPPLAIRVHTTIQKFLVETCRGEFLCVDIYFLHEDVLDIWVFKLDFDEKVWIRIKKLDDEAIFIGCKGGQVLACSTKESRIQGNRIYFTLEEDRSLYEYDLDLCGMEVCLPCPNVEDDWSQFDWILPLLEDN